MKYLFIFLFVYLSTLLYSQEMVVDWDECFGDMGSTTYSKAIEMLPDGTTVVTLQVHTDNSAYSNYHGGFDAWVLLLDNYGNIMLEKCFGGGANETFFDIEVTGSFIYFLGYTESTDGDVQSEPVGGPYDLWVVKTDFELNIIWEKRYGALGPQEPHAAKITPEGGLILLMDFFSQGGGDVSEYYGNTDIWVCEIDADGEILWEKTLGNEWGTFAGNILHTKDGNVIVLGEMDIGGGMVCNGHNNNGTRDIWVVALTGTGELLWQNCYGGSAWEMGIGIIEDNGGYTITGLTQSHDGDISFNHGDEEQTDAWLIHIDDMGNLLWENCYGGSSNDDGIHVYKTNEGGFFLLGISQSRDGDVNQVNCPYAFCHTNTWVIELDSNRDIIWNRTYGPQGYNSYHEKNAVKRIGERDFMIAGIIHDTDNHTGDVDCEPYPINNGKSAWVYRLYDPLDGVNSLSYASLKTYPNPANNQLFIDLPEHHNKVEIEIIDVFGHAIKKINALAQQTQVLWDCSKTATGVYFYQSEINGVVYRGKIVVQ